MCKSILMHLVSSAILFSLFSRPAHLGYINYTLTPPRGDF